jgi:hypothetical protein
VEPETEIEKEEREERRLSQVDLLIMEVYFVKK